jgi:hypothetical protein
MYIAMHVAHHGPALEGPTDRVNVAGDLLYLRRTHGQRSYSFELPVHLLLAVDGTGVRHPRLINAQHSIADNTRTRGLVTRLTGVGVGRGASRVLFMVFAVCELGERIFGILLAPPLCLYVRLCVREGRRYDRRAGDCTQEASERLQPREFTRAVGGEPAEIPLGLFSQNAVPSKHAICIVGVESRIPTANGVKLN